MKKRYRSAVVWTFIMLAAGCAGSAAQSDSADEPDTTASPENDMADADAVPNGAVDSEAATDATSTTEPAPETTETPEEVVEDTPLEPGLGIDYTASDPGATPRYELANTEWTATPWPSDRLRTEGGGLDLTNFPNPQSVDMLTYYIDHATEVLRGFGLNSAVYFQFDQALDVDALPSPEDTRGDLKSVVQMVNVSQGSHRYGERMPLLFEFYGGGTDPYYLPNTLAMRPVNGFPLAEEQTYCAIVTRGVLDNDGRYLQIAPEFLDTLHTDDTLTPLLGWLPDSYILEEDIASATCFTTDDPTSELRVVREYLQSQAAPTVDDIEYLGSTKTFHEFQGHYNTPNFQAGEKPYETIGGQLEFHESGEPIIQEQEEIRVSLLTPKSVEMPEAGWPVILYAHGTGGDFESCKNSVAEDLAKEGFALLCIDQPMHGERGDETWFIELLTFNFFNPYSGRTNFRQSAIDTMVLTQMVRAGVFQMEVGATSFEEDVLIDEDNIHFFGHSQGGLSGAIALGVEPNIGAAVLSGAGGILLETIMRRKDFADIEILTSSLLEIPDQIFSVFHPTMSLIQMLVDATDPVNYAQYWMEPLEDGTQKHIFMTEGLLDAATPYVATNALAAAARVPLLSPVAETSIAHIMHSLPVFEMPVTENVMSTTGVWRTSGLRQWGEGDHFVAFDYDEQGRAMWKSFFGAIADGYTPIIDAD